MELVIIGFAAIFIGLVLLWWLAQQRARLLGVALIVAGAIALFASRPSEERREQLEADHAALCRQAAGKLDVFRETYDKVDLPGWMTEKHHEWSGMGHLLDPAISYCVSREALDSCFRTAAIARPGTATFSANIDALIHGLTTGQPCK